MSVHGQPATLTFQELTTFKPTMDSERSSELKDIVSQHQCDSVFPFLTSEPPHKGFEENVNTRVKGPLRHEIITIAGRGSSALRYDISTDQRLRLNEADLPLNVSAALQTLPVVVTERRIGPKHDHDLFSKASKIVQEQRANDPNDDFISFPHQVEDEPELVVIREYIFATKKNNTDSSAMAINHIEAETSLEIAPKRSVLLDGPDASSKTREKGSNFKAPPVAKKPVMTDKPGMGHIKQVRDPMTFKGTSIPSQDIKYIPRGKPLPPKPLVASKSSKVKEIAEKVISDLETADREGSVIVKPSSGVKVTAHIWDRSVASGVSDAKHFEMKDSYVFPHSKAFYESSSLEDGINWFVPKDTSSLNHQVFQTSISGTYAAVTSLLEVQTTDTTSNHTTDSVAYLNSKQHREDGQMIGLLPHSDDQVKNPLYATDLSAVSELYSLPDKKPPFLTKGFERHNPDEGISQSVERDNFTASSHTDKVPSKMFKGPPGLVDEQEIKCTSIKSMTKTLEHKATVGELLNTATVDDTSNIDNPLKDKQRKDETSSNVRGEIPDAQNHQSTIRDIMKEHEYNKPWDTPISTFDGDIRNCLNSIFPYSMESDKTSVKENESHSRIVTSLTNEPLSLRLLSSHNLKFSEVLCAQDEDKDKKLKVDPTVTEISSDLSKKDLLETDDPSVIYTEPKSTSRRDSLIVESCAIQESSSAGNISFLDRVFVQEKRISLSHSPQPSPPQEPTVGYTLAKCEDKDDHLDKTGTNFKDKLKKVFSHSAYSVEEKDRHTVKSEQKKLSPNLQKKINRLKTNVQDDELKDGGHISDVKCGLKNGDDETLKQMQSDESKTEHKINLFFRGKSLDSKVKSVADRNNVHKMHDPEKKCALLLPDNKELQDSNDGDHSCEQQVLGVKVHALKVQLPLTPKEAKKIIKAEKKSAAQRQKEEVKEAADRKKQHKDENVIDKKKRQTSSLSSGDAYKDQIQNQVDCVESQDTQTNTKFIETADIDTEKGTEEAKLSSPNATRKALNWFKKKLVVKGVNKKASQHNNYDFSHAEAEKESRHDAGECDSDVMDGLSRSGDINSASNESSLSSVSSHSTDTEQEHESIQESKQTKSGEKRKKTHLRHTALNKTKKNKKHQEQHKSDSGTSEDESRSKMFSWTLDRKKGMDPWDNKENQSENLRKRSANWSLASEDDSRVSGTYRKISLTESKTEVPACILQPFTPDVLAKASAQNTENVPVYRPSNHQPSTPQLYTQQDSEINSTKKSSNPQESVNASSNVGQSLKLGEHGYQLAKPLEKRKKYGLTTNSKSLNYLTEECVQLSSNINKTDNPVIKDHQEVSLLEKCLCEDHDAEKCTDISQHTDLNRVSLRSSPKLGTRRVNLPSNTFHKNLDSDPNKLEFIGQHSVKKVQQDKFMVDSAKVYTDKNEVAAKSQNLEEMMQVTNKAEMPVLFKQLHKLEIAHDGSSELTYIDGPEFLESAKASWSKVQPEKYNKNRSSPEQKSQTSYKDIVAESPKPQLVSTLEKERDKEKHVNNTEKEHTRQATSIENSDKLPFSQHVHENYLPGFDTTFQPSKEVLDSTVITQTFSDSERASYKVEHSANLESSCATERVEHFQTPDINENNILNSKKKNQEKRVNIQSVNNASPVLSMMTVVKSGQPYMDHGTERTPVIEHGPERTPVMEIDPEGTPVMEIDPEGTPVMEIGPEGTPVMEIGPEGTPVMDIDPEGTPVIKIGQRIGSKEATCTLACKQSAPIITQGQVDTLSTLTYKNAENKLYEPIFHDDKDHHSVLKLPNDLAPFRQENDEDATSSIESDEDKMYDVPPARPELQFPREESMPVASVVDKRNSKLVLVPINSFQAEDSIAPYATYHGPQHEKSSSDYDGEDNLYMNDDDEELVKYFDKKRSQYKPASIQDEIIHGCLKEILPEISKVKGETSDAFHIYASLEDLKTERYVPSEDCNTEKDAKEEMSAEAPEMSDLTGSVKTMPGLQLTAKLLSSYSPSLCGPENTVLSHSPSLHGPENTVLSQSPSLCDPENTVFSHSPTLQYSSPTFTLTEKESSFKFSEMDTGSIMKVKTMEDVITENIILDDEKEIPSNETQESNDHYLNSPEYKHSMDEINKLFAALEEEERQMESEASVKHKFAEKNVTKLLSYEDQRADFKLKAKVVNEFTSISLDSDKEEMTSAAEKSSLLKISSKGKPVGDLTAFVIETEKAEKHTYVENKPKQNIKEKTGGNERKHDTNLVAFEASRPDRVQSTSSLFKLVTKAKADKAGKTDRAEQPSQMGRQSGEDTTTMVPTVSKESGTHQFIFSDRSVPYFQLDLPVTTQDKSVSHQPVTYAHIVSTLPESGGGNQEQRAWTQQAENETSLGNGAKQNQHHLKESEIRPMAKSGPQYPAYTSRPTEGGAKLQSAGDHLCPTAEIIQQASHLSPKCRKTPPPPPPPRKAELDNVTKKSDIVQPPDSCGRGMQSGGGSVPTSTGSVPTSTEHISSVKAAEGVTAVVDICPPRPALRTSPFTVRLANQGHSRDGPAAVAGETTLTPRPKPRACDDREPLHLQSAQDFSASTEPSAHHAAARLQSAPSSTERPQKPPRPQPAEKKRSLPLFSSHMSSSVDLEDLDSVEEMGSQDQSDVSKTEREGVDNVSKTEREGVDNVSNSELADVILTVGNDKDEVKLTCDSVAQADVMPAGDSTDKESDNVLPEDEWRAAAEGSPPLPDRRYRRKAGKYNEYSNVIRIDSSRLRGARVKSLSSAALEEQSEVQPQPRRAISVEGGLDKEGESEESLNATKRPKQNKEISDKCTGVEKKSKLPHFSFRPFRNMFGGRKKCRAKEGEAELARGEEERRDDDNNLYEEVEETNLAPDSHGTQTVLHMLEGTRPTQSQSQGAPAVDNTVDSPSSRDARPIGRLLQLNSDGTQLVELIRPPTGHLGIQLTQGNEETLKGKFVSGFVDKSTEKLLSGILSVGDRILKINDHSVNSCPLLAVHDIIDTHQRLKFLVYPAQ